MEWKWNIEKFSFYMRIHHVLQFRYCNTWSSYQFGIRRIYMSNYFWYFSLLCRALRIIPYSGGNNWHLSGTEYFNLALCSNFLLLRLHSRVGKTSGNWFAPFRLTLNPHRPSQFIDGLQCDAMRCIDFRVSEKGVMLHICVFSVWCLRSVISFGLIFFLTRWAIDQNV